MLGGCGIERIAFHVAIIVGVALATGGCAATTGSKPMVQATAGSSAFVDPPQCVAILPGPPGVEPAFATLVEDSLQRHVSASDRRVVSAQEVAATARSGAIGLDSRDGRAALAESLACEAVLLWRPLAAGSQYALIWTLLRVELEVAVRRASDDAVLWAARNAAVRQDGGIPFNPIAAAIGAARAAYLENNVAVLASLVDDALRPMFADGPI